MKDLIQIESKTYKRLEEIYKNHKSSIWEIGWSGGKDSTLLLHLLLFYFIKLKKRGSTIPRTYIIHTDTLLEHPLLQKVTEKAANNISLFLKENFYGNVKLIWLTPDKDFFWKMIVEGYPLPHYRFRWCVNWLKEKPMKNFIQQLNLNKDDILVEITGIRLDESKSREKIMLSRSMNYNDAFFQGKEGNKYFYAPIYDLSTVEVFEYLRKKDPIWGGTNKELLKLYEKTTRYGCVLCTVVKKDKMLDPKDEIDKKFIELKSRLMEISQNKNNRIIKNGKLSKLTVSARYEVAKLFMEYKDIFPLESQKRIENSYEALKEQFPHS